MYDIIIRNGTVVDGTGKSGFNADVSVNGDRIEKIGDLKSARGKVEIDAGGKIVSPGFIDIHNHSDNHWRIFLDPQLPSLVHQGVTTVIGGNCGTSIAPLSSGKIIESIQKWVDLKRVNVDWLSFSQFAEKMKERKLGINFASLVGHETIRRGLLFDEMRRLDHGELENFERALARSLEEGAFGFSLGLAYSHERSATWDELEEFAEIAKDHEKIVTIHLRDEAGGIAVAVKEALDLARQTGISLQISHLKVMGEKNWPLMDEAISQIEKARDAGVDVNFDVYPYTQTGSVLYVFLPFWAAEGGKKMLLKRLKEKHLRQRVIDEMKETAQYHYEDAIIAACSFSKSLTKRRISEIAAERNISVEEAIIDLLVASEGRVITIMECLSEDNVRKAIKHPLSIIASDGAGYDEKYAESGELVHPRSFGTFPRILSKYVREEKLLSLEEAIRKMTGLPAKKFGIHGRGTVEKGTSADLVVFDPKIVSDKATVEEPYKYPEGIEQVIVNGKFAIRDRKMTDGMNGIFLTA